MFNFLRRLFPAEGNAKLFHFRSQRRGIHFEKPSCPLFSIYSSAGSIKCVQDVTGYSIGKSAHFFIINRGCGFCNIDNSISDIVKDQGLSPAAESDGNTARRNQPQYKITESQDLSRNKLIAFNVNS